MTQSTGPTALTGTAQRFLHHGSALSLLLKVSATGLSFATGVFLARVLGPVGYGSYAYVMAVITLLALPGALGMPQLLVRHIAAYQYHAEWGLMRGLLQWCNRAALQSAVVLAALAAAAAWLLAGQLPASGPPLLWLALPLVPLLALAALRVAALQGLHHVVLAQLPEGLLRPGMFLAGAVLAYLLLGPNFGIFWAIGLQVGATAMAFAVGAWLLAHLRPMQLDRARARFRRREWRASTLPLLFVSGVFVINTQADLLMLGLLGPATDVGVYRVATRGAQVVLFCMIAANLTAAPVFSRLYQQGDHEQLQRLVTLTARMMLAFALPLALLLMIFGAPILVLLFGPAYAGGAVALAILAAGQLVNAGTGSASELLMMTGHERANARVAAVGVVTNVGLNALLIPAFGIAGAAAATATSIATVNGLLAVSVRRYLRLDPTIIGRVPRPEH